MTKAEAQVTALSTEDLVFIGSLPEFAKQVEFARGRSLKEVAPNSKPQTPSKPQAPNSNSAMNRLDAWGLALAVFGSWLSGLDSNQDKGLQRPLCYHYTTGHAGKKLVVRRAGSKTNLPNAGVLPEVRRSADTSPRRFARGEALRTDGTRSSSEGLRRLTSAATEFWNFHPRKFFSRPCCFLRGAFYSAFVLTHTR